ncbi:MAG TPA: tRNA pseudouridine(55) synthase TruB [Armatimonadota bacterium]|nr:tRNA pseudouridine(55) synthase TruB [Armatimonadota bacterium]
MHGILNINKPAGPTSHDIVAKVRRILKEKRVGHTGTLDPMAVGVLVVCVGKATRIVEYLVGQEKEYSAELVLGRTTTTQDAEGTETSSANASHITPEMVEEALSKFRGQIMQVPPMVSAVKHEGKRLYELARKDIEVERKPRQVTIYELEMTGFILGDRPVVGLRVVCSSGTYIRTLCADIGEALGVGGYMKSLVRNRVGTFRLEDSISLDELQQAAEEGRAEQLMVSMDEALASMPSVDVDSFGEKMIARGVTVAVAGSGNENELVRVRSESGELLAVGRLHLRGAASVVKPEKVFAEAGQ